MTTLLCPTRGGQASYANQDGAIRLAKEREASLIFLYISSVEFLGQVAAPIPVDMETELEHLGEFVLAMAQERAESAGIEAQAIVKHGELGSALREAVEELQPDIVVFGSSGTKTAELTRSYLDELAESLSQESGVEVFFLKEGEVERHIPSA
jgi:nucleotide-binding universal stress UspA family protein